MPIFGDGAGDVCHGATEGVDLPLEIFDDGFIFFDDFVCVLLIQFDEVAEVVWVVEEVDDFVDDFFFEGAGGDGLEVAIEAAIAACAGVAQVVGSVALF